VVFFCGECLEASFVRVDHWTSNFHTTESVVG
jgi:hypothetical protein